MKLTNTLQTSIKSSTIPAFEPILYDPGIPGFIKSHRHHSGPAVVMTTWEEEDRDLVSVFWVKRLHHAAIPVQINKFWLWTEQTMKAAERAYDLSLIAGPPFRAQSDFQRKRVYDWEDDNIFLWRDQQLTWIGCNRFLNHVWKNCGNGTIPQLTDQMRFKNPISLPGKIHLSTNWNWNKPTILHEIAHQFDFSAQHGPRFVARYMNLLVNFLGMDRQFLQETADRYNVLYR